MQRAVRAVGPGASERARIHATLLQFLPLDDERRAATILFRAYHEGGVNGPATGVEARKAPQRFQATMVDRLEVARADGLLRDDVDIQLEAAIYQLVVSSLGESILAGFVTDRQAHATIDYLLDRAFVPPPSRPR